MMTHGTSICKLIIIQVTRISNGGALHVLCPCAVCDVSSSNGVLQFPIYTFGKNLLVACDRLLWGLLPDPLWYRDVSKTFSMVCVSCCIHITPWAHSDFNCDLVVFPSILGYGWEIMSQRNPYIVAMHVIISCLTMSVKEALDISIISDVYRTTPYGLFMTFYNTVKSRQL